MHPDWNPLASEAHARWLAVRLDIRVRMLFWRASQSLRATSTAMLLGSTLTATPWLRYAGQLPTVPPAIPASVHAAQRR